MKKVIQNDIYDCGICSLKAILNYYHGDVPLEVLRYDTYTDCGGTDMYHLLNAAKKYGLDGYGKKVLIDELNDLPLPVICHTVINNSYEHFMVIEKLDNNYVYLMDPQVGNVKKRRNEFADIFTGKVLVLYPVSKLKVFEPKKSLFKVIVDLIIEEKNLLIKLITVTFIISLLTILYSLFFKTMLNDNIIINMPQLIKLAIFYSGLLFLIMFFSFYKDYYLSFLSKNVDAFIKDTFIKHIFYLPSYSIKSRNPGEILTRLNELNNYKTLLTDYVVNLLLDMITVIFTGIVLFIINWRLMLLLGLIIIFYLLFSLIVNKYIKKAIDEVLTCETEFNSNLIENVENLDSLKYLHLEEKNYYENAKLNSKMIYANFKFELNLHKITLIKNVIHEFGLFLINVLGIYLIYHQQLSFINLITFNMIVVYFKEPIKSYIDALPKISYVNSSYQKLSEFFQISDESFTNQANLLDYGDISFRNVAITYDGINKVIDHVSFNLKKDSKVLIKGKSGSGKSSLCKALYRLNDNYDGDILINNQNIKDIDLNIIRSNIGYLGQKEGLFSDTIYNNIVMHRSVSDLEFKRVCEICHIDEILNNKPLRYQTMLYEGGKNLSGGERQRILLARILLKYPDILILDEALSELNINLEKQILNNLRTYLNNRILIYISHRQLDNLFDKVVYLNEG